MQAIQKTTDISMQIENLKVEMKFETYLETILYYYQELTDLDMDAIAKLLNQKIKGCLEVESQNAGLIKKDNMVRLL